MKRSEKLEHDKVPSLGVPMVFPPLPQERGAKITYKVVFTQSEWPTDDLGAMSSAYLSPLRPLHPHHSQEPEQQILSRHGHAFFHWRHRSRNPPSKTFIPFQESRTDFMSSVYAPDPTTHDQPSEQARFLQDVLERYGALQKHPVRDLAWCHVTAVW